MLGILQNFGPLEVAIIAGVLLLLFGARLPRVMRSLGQSVVEFKKGVKGISEDADDAAGGKDEKGESPEGVEDRQSSQS